VERWQKGKWCSDLARSRIKSLHRSIQSDSTFSPQAYDTTAVISQQLCQVECHHAGNSIGCKSHSDNWADPFKIAQGLEPAAHNSLFAGSILFKSDPRRFFVRTTKERLDRRLRTTRSAPLRTTRILHAVEVAEIFSLIFLRVDFSAKKFEAVFFRFLAFRTLIRRG
jgi:hypothetical protein